MTDSDFVEYALPRLELLEEFAFEMLDAFEYDQPWAQCPHCLWAEHDGAPEHNCVMERVARMVRP